MYLGKFYRFFAEIRRAAVARWARRPPGEKPRPLAAFSHKKTRYPHEVDTGLKSLATRVRTVSALGSRVIRTWFNAAHAKTLPREDAQEGLHVGLSRMLRA